MKFFLFFSKKSLTAPSGFGKLINALINSGHIYIKFSVQHAILDCSQALPMFGITSKVSVFTSQTSKCSAHSQHHRCYTMRGTVNIIDVAQCASGSVGGARPCQGRGRGLESRLAL